MWNTHKPTHRRRPRVDELEDRSLPSGLVVYAELPPPPSYSVGAHRAALIALADEIEGHFPPPPVVVRADHTARAHLAEGFATPLHPLAIEAWPDHAVSGHAEVASAKPLPLPAFGTASDRGGIIRFSDGHITLAGPPILRIAGDRIDLSDLPFAGRSGDFPIRRGLGIIIAGLGNSDDDASADHNRVHPTGGADDGPPDRAESRAGVRFSRDARGYGFAPRDEFPVALTDPDGEPAAVPGLETDEPDELRATVEPEAAPGPSKVRDEVAPPQGAGPLTDVLPFERAPLEEAIDRFFDHIEDLAAAPLGWHDPTMTIPPALALPVAAMVLEMARRWLRRASGDAPEGRDSDGAPGFPAFPELPGPWSMRPS